MRSISHLLKNFFKYRFFLVRIEGESAWPALVPGSGRLATGLMRPRRGDFIVFKNPRNSQEIFVKRVTAEKADGYIVESVVSWGSSSRDFGPVPQKNILGKLLFIG
jgi:signal peptidase I